MAEMLDQRVNPWLDLPVSPPYVLPEDLAVLRRYPRALASLVFAGPPGPFIGNPSSARVILLSLGIPDSMRAISMPPATRPDPATVARCAYPPRGCHLPSDSSGSSARWGDRPGGPGSCGRLRTYSA